MNNATNHTSVFDNKEQYLAFRAKWKSLYAEGFHTRQRKEYAGGSRWISATQTIETAPPGFRMVSPLTVWHHLVFNIAIGRNPPVNAFGDRTTRAVAWGKQYLYYNIRYSGGNFDVFGDTLTDAQKAIINAKVDEYLSHL